MDYQNLTVEQKEKINSAIKDKYPDSEMNIDDIQIVKLSDDSLRISYQGINVEIPIQKPDQQTSNSIWQVLAGGAIAIAAVATTLILSKDK